MTYSENTQRVLATYDAVNRRDLDAVWADVADDYRMVDHAQGMTANTKEEARSWMDTILAASSDMRCEVVDVIDSPDATVVRVRSTGTADGEFAGIPPTGRRITLDQCEVYRFDDRGLLAEGHVYYDLYSLLAQLGAVPELAAEASHA